MITKKDIQKPRSPRDLRKFVCSIKEKVRAVESERHAAMRKRGVYKVFSDEIIPLSIFALKIYPNSCSIQPELGNQAYDAIVKDSAGKPIDYIEITFPHDGQRDAKDAKLVISRGFGDIHIDSLGKDIDRLNKFVLETCLKKSKKDYSNCTLVIVIDFWPVKEHRLLYSRKIDQVLTQIKTIPFKARRVFLLLLEQKKILKVYG